MPVKSKGGSIIVTPPPDKFRQFVKHVIQFQQAAEQNMNRLKSAANTLNLHDDVSDIYEDGFSDALELEGIVVAGVVRSASASNSMQLKQKNTIAGGRTDIGSGLGLPQVTYLSDTPKGAPLYVPQAGEAELAQGDSPFTTRVMGLANEGGSAGDTGFFVNSGWLTQSDWTNVTGTSELTPNAYYYLSDTDAGKLSTLAPTTDGTFVTAVGLALDTETMFVSISQPIEL